MTDLSTVTQKLIDLEVEKCKAICNFLKVEQEMGYITIEKHNDQVKKEMEKSQLIIKEILEGVNIG